MNRLTSRLALGTLAALALAAAPAAFAATLKMEVNGLVCSFCAHGIKSAFEKQPAAGEVLVSLENRLVAVDLKDGADISDDTATKLMTDAGFTVVKLERVETPVAELRAGLPRGD